MPRLIYAFLFEYVFSHCLVHIPIVNCLISEPSEIKKKDFQLKKKIKKKTLSRFMFF